MMRRFLLFSLLLVLLQTVTAQTGNFLYLQSENNLPYEAKWNGKSFTSSPSGYLVIPQIASGTQSIEVDFGPAIAQPHTFSLAVHDKPLGYSIRQSVTNSLSLFDMITNALIRGKQQPVLAKSPREPEQLILSKEETDKLLAEKASLEKKQTAPVMAASTAPAANKPATPVWQNPVKDVRKIFDKESTEGFDQVYVLSAKNRIDTIALFIPVLQDLHPKQSAMLAPALYKQTRLAVDNKNSHR